MSLPLVSETSEIQARLDELIKQEEQKKIELKAQIDQLTKQMSEQNIETPGLCDVEFGLEVVLHAGSGTYSGFVAFMRAPIGADANDNIGFRDDQGRIVHLRTDHDIHHMFRWYFAAELPFIQIISIPKSDIELISKFDFRKEVMQREGCAIFRCEAAGPDAPLTFLMIPSTLNRDDGFTYLRQIYGQFNSLMFVDEAEDIITIDSNESWEYCIETGIAMSKVGKYQLLLVQFQN